MQIICKLHANYLELEGGGGGELSSRFLSDEFAFIDNAGFGNAVRGGGITAEHPLVALRQVDGSRQGRVWKRRQIGQKPFGSEVKAELLERVDDAGGSGSGSRPAQCLVEGRVVARVGRVKRIVIVARGHP